MRRSHFLASFLMTALTLHAQTEGNLEPLRDGAAYVLADRSIQVVTPAPLASTIKALNALFISQHPGVIFTVLTGDNYSTMAALTFDRTAFAPLGTQFTRIGLGDNLKIAAEPVGIRIAHASLTPGAGVPALGLIVNLANPLTSLSLAQLARIFAVGAPSGDIATWSQAGVRGDLAGREPHPVGPYASDYLDSDDPQAGEFLSNLLLGLNMSHTYEPLAHYADVIRRVAEDPSGIGITALSMPLTGVKVLPLRRTETAPAIPPDAAHIGMGAYPLDRAVYIYLRLGKGMPLDAFGRQYVRMVLSPEGQQIIAANETGYIALNEADRAEELARLDR